MLIGIAIEPQPPYLGQRLAVAAEQIVDEGKFIQRDRPALRFRSPQVDRPDDRGRQITEGLNSGQPVAAHGPRSRVHSSYNEAYPGVNAEAEDDTPNVMPPGDSELRGRYPHEQQHATPEQFDASIQCQNKPA